jgi:hypothetical protein
MLDRAWVVGYNGLVDHQEGAMCILCTSCDAYMNVAGVESLHQRSLSQLAYSEYKGRLRLAGHVDGG